MVAGTDLEKKNKTNKQENRKSRSRDKPKIGL